MPISELGPRYDNVSAQAREAEILRRSRISNTQLTRSAEERAAISARISSAIKGQPKSKEQVEKQSPIWTAIRPLVLRDGLTSEIMDITGFTKWQVNNAKYSKKHPEWRQVPGYSAPGKETERRRRSHQGKPNKLENRQPISEDQKKNNNFAKKILDAGLITDDLLYWNALNSLYLRLERNLPEEFSDKLRLELFLKGQVHRFTRQDVSLIRTYRDMGQRIDSSWFPISLAIDERLVTRFVEEEYFRHRQGPYMIKDGVVVFGLLEKA